MYTQVDGEMEWFGDSVVNAISQCRQQRALFIVYIRGKRGRGSYGEGGVNGSGPVWER